MSDTSTHPDSSGRGRKPAKKQSDKPGLFARISLFIREVIAELRKVVGLFDRPGTSIGRSKSVPFPAERPEQRGT